MGVKLGVLRYKRLKVFENRELGENICESEGERRWQEVGKNCMREVP